jgi:hypothetical protein
MAGAAVVVNGKSFWFYLVIQRMLFLLRTSTSTATAVYAQEQQHKQHQQ